MPKFNTPNDLKSLFDYAMATLQKDQPKTKDSREPNPRAAIQKRLSPLGLKVKFWSTETIDNIKALTQTPKLKDNLSMIDTPFSLWQPVNIKPIPAEFQTRIADSVGFMTLTPEQILFRGNIRNVVSCHRIPSGEFCFGNLSYLSNPSWTTFAFYKQADSQAIYNEYPGIDDGGPKDMEMLKGLPNILATCNVCLAFTPVGDPVALVSRFYGDEYVDKTRFVEYLTVTLGLQVIAIQSQGGPWDSLRHWQNYLDNTKTTSGKVETFRSLAFPTQFEYNAHGFRTLKGRRFEYLLPKRYPDIAPPLRELKEDGDGKETIYVGEELQGYRIAEKHSSSVAPITYVPWSTSDLYISVQKKNHSAERIQNNMELAKLISLKDFMLADRMCSYCRSRGREAVVTDWGIGCTDCMPQATFVSCGEFGMLPKKLVTTYIDAMGNRQDIPLEYLNFEIASSVGAVGEVILHVSLDPDLAPLTQGFAHRRWVEYIHLFSGKDKHNIDVKPAYVLKSDLLGDDPKIKMVVPTNISSRGGSGLYILSKDLDVLWTSLSARKMVLRYLDSEATSSLSYVDQWYDLMFPDIKDKPKYEPAVQKTQTVTGDVYYTVKTEGGYTVTV